MRRADQRKHHYIYRITRADGKYYIGMHSTDDLEDGYFGSGSLLSRSIKKHGIEKHSKAILEHLPSRESLRLREKELVDQAVLNDPMNMNLQLGGGGGWEYTIKCNRGRSLSDEHKAKLSVKLKANNGMKNPETRKKVSETLSKHVKTEEHRERLREAAKRQWEKKRSALAFQIDPRFSSTRNLALCVESDKYSCHE